MYQKVSATDVNAEAWRRGGEKACCSARPAYLKMVAKKVTHAEHALDRFHIAQQLGQAINQLRAAEAMPLKKVSAALATLTC